MVGPSSLVNESVCPHGPCCLNGFPCRFKMIQKGSRPPSPDYASKFHSKKVACPAGGHLLQALPFSSLTPVIANHIRCVVCDSSRSILLPLLLWTFSRQQSTLPFTHSFNARTSCSSSNFQPRRVHESLRQSRKRETINT